MSIKYIYPHSNTIYRLSYKDLQKDFESFQAMTDKQFVKNLPKIIHYACIVCYLKEKPLEVISDEGIIHELVHCLTNTFGQMPIKELRQLFELECVLI